MRVHSHFPVKGASNVSLGNGYISHIVNGFPGNSIDKRPFDKVFTRGNIILWWIAVRLMAMTQNVVEPEGLVGGRRKRGTRATQYLWWKRWVSFLGWGGCRSSWMFSVLPDMCCSVSFYLVPVVLYLETQLKGKFHVISIWPVYFLPAIIWG